jgi:hypothetical protein
VRHAPSARSLAAAAAFVVSFAGPAPSLAAPTTGGSAAEEDPTFGDPRKPRLPRTHRFRLGVEVLYERLSKAINEDTGETQRFHFAPFMLDLAYQAQFLKYVMIRPAFAFGPNIANTSTSMPFVIHPKLHFGYQGAIVGAAIGYGFFTSVIYQQDAISEIRGGLEQPTIWENHHVDAELSATTRVDRGALSFIVRGGAVHGHLLHLTINKERWDFLLTFNGGWYFGDGTRAKKRQKERRERRRQRR